MELVLDLGETRRSRKHRELLIAVKGAIGAVIPGRAPPQNGAAGRFNA